MVEVFKTNITEKNTAKKLAEELCQIAPNVKINFDLDDCDRILRVESEQDISMTVIKHLCQLGYVCQIIE